MGVAIFKYERSIMVRSGLIVLGMAVGWGVAGWLVAPSVIRSAYAGTSLPVFNDMVWGQAYYTLDEHLAKWPLYRLRITLYLLLASGLLLASAPFQRSGFTALRTYLSKPPTANLAQLVALGSCAGWLGGFLQASWLFVDRFAKPGGQSDEAFWMATSAGLVTGALMGLMVWILFRARAPSLRVGTLLLFTPFTYSVVRASGIGVHPLAALILAVGVGDALGRMASRRPLWIRRSLRLAIPLMAGLSLTILGVKKAVERYEHRASLQGLVDAPTDVPNVLLVILDTQRASRMSLYGNPRPTTPNVDRLARRGVVFDEMMSTTSWTLPAHASMLTGQWAFEVSADWFTGLDEEAETLAEVLSDAGYETGAFVANTGFASARTGLDQGFSVYRDFQISLGAWVDSHELTKHLTNFVRRQLGMRRDLNRKRAPEVNKEFLAWEQKVDRPFFAMLNYFDVHDKFESPPPFDTLYRSPAPRYWIKSWGRLREYNEADVSEQLDAYDSALTYLDFHLGQLFETLEDRGVLENTLVIVTSDHGEHFGEDDLVGHGSTLYRPVVRVPLVVVHPQSVPAGKRVPSPASIRDLAATVLDVLGISEGRLPGRSLARFWQAADPSVLPMKPIYTNLSDWGGHDPPGDKRGIAYGQLHFIVNGDGSEELYDIASDPGQAINLAGRPDYEEALRRLKARLPESGWDS